jgi:general L-amino acid transport system permease protein
MIPPLASQYLNITKNSSLAVAVGYYEITRVYSTVTNNAAPPPQAIAVLMVLYLTFSLGISLIANVINRRLQLDSR